MTAGWKESILIAIDLFPIFAFIMTLPFMVHQYRKYGSIPFIRFLCIYGFSFYMVCAYFLVIFPLPPIDQVAQMTSDTMNLKLFRGYSEWTALDGFHLFEPQSWMAFLKGWKGLEPLCNVIMTIPFGFFLHYYCRKKLISTTLYSFTLSAFFELSQLSGLFGIYPRPYRLFDVNDLFNNTLGGAIGWIITPLFCWFLPSREAIDRDAYRHSERVSFTRRVVALVIDELVISSIFAVIAIFVDIKYKFYVEIAAAIIGLTIVMYVTKGLSIGKKILKIRLVNSKTGHRPGFFGLLIRTSIVHGLILGFVNNPDKFVPVNAALEVSGVVWMAGLAILILLLLDMLLHRSENRRILFYEKLTRTKNIEILK